MSISNLLKLHEIEEGEIFEDAVSKTRAQPRMISAPMGKADAQVKAHHKIKQAATNIEARGKQEGLEKQEKEEVQNKSAESAVSEQDTNPTNTEADPVVEAAAGSEDVSSSGDEKAADKSDDKAADKTDDKTEDMHVALQSLGLNLTMLVKRGRNVAQLECTAREMEQMKAANKRMKEENALLLKQNSMLNNRIDQLEDTIYLTEEKYEMWADRATTLEKVIENMQSTRAAHISVGSHCQYAVE